MDGFQIIYMLGDNLLLTTFHFIINTNSVRINFLSNPFYFLSEVFVVKIEETSIPYSVLSIRT